ncbi:hypothetical protein [Shewanella sp. GD03713]|uniref:hypothetical protein n=1 Tax=Shewanella sp. GD03713 TaxID=2975372 RepID=UPI002447DB11|nr:hypothetical protein [Shewanella sp. GD03713]MDH1472532.1 hypothetical protein [Shewanella sp. GD03713]
MGYIGTFGTATTAPEHHCNTFGTPSWSGKHEDDFTSVLEQELREFIKREAKRYGNNDRVQNIVGENQNFFNEHFLSGWPHALWLEYYQLGMEERASLNMPSFDEVWPSMPI